MIFQIIAMALMLLFYGAYFVKMLLQKKKGMVTDQLGKGKVGFVKFVEIATKAATYLTALADALCILLGVSALPTPARIAGACLAALGVTFFLLSVCTLGDNWRAGVPEADQTQLVTGGIYGISRNPAFLGFDLLYLGILLMFFHWILLVLSAFAVVFLHLQIVNVEEDHLFAIFGDDYLAYRRKVCRYLGRKS